MRPTTLPALWQFALAIVAVGVTASPAHAYTIQSAATKGCHELVTRQAWKTARAALPETTGALPSSGDDSALIDDLAFNVPKSLRDIGSVTLLLGVRDNDVKQYGAHDLKSLTPVASDPELQHEHCLRAPDQDEPNGSRDAVEACRAYIRRELEAALDGLDEAGRPDPALRENLKVSLAIRGEIDVSVPRFFLHAGRALHALEDSFTHTFRNPDDPGKIRVVLNYVEYSENRLNEAVDGPPHSSEMDRCDDPDELRTDRHRLAVEAASHALIAVLDPTNSRADKQRAIERVLDDYVSFDSSARCSKDNDWCDAPERGYGTAALGCSAAPSSIAQGAGWMLGLLLVAGALGWRTWRRLGTLLAVIGIGCWSGTARAQSSDGVTTPITSDSSIAQAPVKPADRAGAFFGRVAIGGSYDNSAFSGGLGARYQLTKNWMLGIDGEWNPYIAITPNKVRAGSANAYISVIRRYQLVRASVNIRTTASLGGSMLLFDLVGADKYSVGPFFGVSFLGAEWKATRGVYVTIDPTYIAIPIPSVTGMPFMYAQYRFLLGLEFGG